MSIINWKVISLEGGNLSSHEHSLPALLGPQWSGLSGLPPLLRFHPIVVLSQPSAPISIRSPITDSLRFLHPIGALFSYESVSMETKKNNVDPQHCCSPLTNSSLNRGSKECTSATGSRVKSEHSAASSHYRP